MGRFYVVALLASLYCGTDACASDLINPPAIEEHKNDGVDRTFAFGLGARDPVANMSTIARDVPSTRLSKGHPATTAVSPALKKHQNAAAAPRPPRRNLLDGETVAPSTTLSAAPISAMGCGSLRWSQPDAAGVPVLICD